MAITSPLGVTVRLVDFFWMSVNLGDVGGPSTLQLAAYLLSDEIFNEWRYATMPGSTFVDAYRTRR